MEAKAVARYIRISPRKARQVADMVRGKSVEDAINLLHFVPQRASGPVEKVLRSAVSNALNREEGAKLDPEDFFIKTIWVDQGPTMRRYSPGPMGRATIIRKRSCHVGVVISNGIQSE
ncbi:50S ribosomal protein L22 [bacterium]|nr:50S ribosomal protein L22 [bacterium]